jgi:uncharacterized protein (TIGR02284 family)
MPNNDALKSLHTSLIDARKGYETAVADAEAPDMKAIFQKMLALHADAHRDVHALLAERGERPDEDGSFMATVHKTVISVRSAVQGLDRASLPSFADGEERIVQAYDEAIAADPGASALRKDRDALVAAIAELRAEAA